MVGSVIPVIPQTSEAQLSSAVVCPQAPANTGGAAMNSVRAKRTLEDPHDIYTIYTIQVEGPPEQIVVVAVVVVVVVVVAVVVVVVVAVVVVVVAVVVVGLSVQGLMLASDDFRWFLKQLAPKKMTLGRNWGVPPKKMTLGYFRSAPFFKKRIWNQITYLQSSRVWLPSGLFPCRDGTHGSN